MTALTKALRDSVRKVQARVPGAGYVFPLHLASEAATELELLTRWVADLQTGMYINCVYCGYRYGPNHTVPAAEALKAHVEKCPKHPMSEMRTALNHISSHFDLVQKHITWCESAVTEVNALLGKQLP